MTKPAAAPQAQRTPTDFRSALEAWEQAVYAESAGDIDEEQLAVARQTLLDVLRPAVMDAPTGAWRYDVKGCETSHGLPIIVKANGHLIAHMCGRDDKYGPFIVRACNAYDANQRTIAALTAALRWTTDICDELLRDGDADERAHIAQARAALAAAEGSQS